MPDTTELLRALVEAETPSDDPELLRRGLRLLARLGTDLVGRAPRWLGDDDHPVLCWAGDGEPEVLVVAHIDTVWPAGTLASWPFAVRDGIATGPGAFDTKAGIVQALRALAALPSLDGVVLLVNSDEEIGSAASRDIIQDHARRCRAALIVEPSLDGAVKIARKGMSRYTATLHGRAAHAGLDPDAGANAALAAAQFALAAAALSDRDAGSRVIPTVMSAGTAINVVPERGSVTLDVRAADEAELVRIDRGLREIPAGWGCRVELSGGIDRPPLEPSSSAELYAALVRVASASGVPRPGAVAAGGASDGNFTAAVGCPTLDGLGAVGGGAHARDEHVVLAEMAPRAALLAALIDEVLRDRGGAHRTGRLTTLHT
ncbi:M20/M25/M40 family metallo-hydrolase [Actinosynnema sp. NPDC023658]|uniref:M20/M25/M40 family metallo-hydrolase n=1 Tax=Actinosynnema sp. NPDC023658 TaxID=3155465 RepID=UPI0033EA8685